MTNIQTPLYNSLLGGAVGDAYGLPFEGLRPSRVAKRFDADNAYHLIPIIKGGMVSDDTEHAVMTVQAINHTLLKIYINRARRDDGASLYCQWG